MKRLLLRLFAPFVGLVILCTPAAAFAWNPFGGLDCNGDASNSAVCQDSQDNGNPIAGPNGLIIRIANFIALIAGMAAVILLLVGGLKYVTARGDSNAVSSAKNTIIYALVGVAVIAISKTLITFVVSKI